MKTNVNIINLKKVAVTFCAALVLTSGSFTQPNPDENANAEMVAAARMEARMNETEHAVRFVAPSVSEITSEMERLNALAESTEVSLKYEAPVAENTPELERLEALACNTEAALQYVAPALSEEEFVIPELERLDMLVAATEASIRFMAPDADEKPAFDHGNVYAPEIMLADKNN
jgi:hypothetical protein